ncbi:hypothetical protein [Brumimicrobium aurantiacum]|uniref:Uncharacterized protein n=1 Tax=Brumimicrobium aurantiacum TaxID=1737063 RepID=A0A3E1EWT7_9FLAO|nr:hypothetical protein [Brumimicrobium aurantiacum]RFC54024.1 hypothetical protein DXU93_10825 [Brumimicrobium aurantiacum]
MNNSEKDQIPKDQEEAEKYYGDKSNTQRKEENLDEVKKNQGESKDKTAAGERKRSNVLTHPKDEKDESFDIDHNEKK